MVKFLVLPQDSVVVASELVLDRTLYTNIEVALKAYATDACGLLSVYEELEQEILKVTGPEQTSGCRIATVQVVHTQATLIRTAPTRGTVTSIG